MIYREQGAWSADVDWSQDRTHGVVSLISILVRLGVLNKAVKGSNLSSDIVTSLATFYYMQQMGFYS